MTGLYALCPCPQQLLAGLVVREKSGFFVLIQPQSLVNPLCPVLGNESLLSILVPPFCGSQTRLVSVVGLEREFPAPLALAGL